MAGDWQALTDLTQGRPVLVERVRIKGQDSVIEGSYELPPLAELSLEDQVFITGFVRTHGSIKKMENLFGISYPTVKNRLKAIAEKLEFVDINPPPSRLAVLQKIQQGELSVEDALKLLSDS